jgi:hypothetical protein
MWLYIIAVCAGVTCSYCLLSIWKKKLFSGDNNSNKLKICFVHPDLGIGGAERLVIDASIACKKLGLHVTIYTSHHDKDHCFQETKDGLSHFHS